VVAVDPETGAQSLARVNAILPGRASQYLSINGELEVTAGHVFWADGDWRRASELAPGMRLLGEDGNAVIIESIEVIDAEVRVYDISIDAPHSYFAEGILVHNKII